MKKMKMLLSLMLSVIVLSVVVSCSKPGEQLAAVAEEFNQKCPISMAGDIKVTKALVENNQFVYNIEVPSVISEIPTGKIDAFKADFLKSLVDNGGAMIDVLVDANYGLVIRLADHAGNVKDLSVSVAELKQLQKKE